MFENERFQISQLEGKARDIEAKAQREGRQLLQAERDLRDELIQTATDIRMKLPANSPLTKPGPQASGNRSTLSGGFGSMHGEYFQAIRAAGMPGGQTDPRLFQAAAGLSETVPSEGGFLVGSDLSTEIMRSAFENGKIARLCRRIQVSGSANGIKIPGLDETSRAAGSRHGGVLSYYIAEAGEKQLSKPKFRLVELNLKKSVVLVYATDELLQDARALEGFIKQVAADEIGFTMDDAVINGTGAGQPLGILNSGALVSVPKETGQANYTVVLENVTRMWSRMIGSSRSNAVWIINQNVEPQLYTMSLSVGTGGAPVFLPGGGVSASPYMTLFGRPVIPIEQCAALGSVGDIILADFGGGYILAEKGGTQADMSIHVRFVWDESLYRFVTRFDGQPMLAAPVTPYKGSLALSHFVALAARTP